MPKDEKVGESVPKDEKVACIGTQYKCFGAFWCAVPIFWRLLVHSTNVFGAQYKSLLHFSMGAGVCLCVKTTAAVKKLFIGLVTSNSF